MSRQPPTFFRLTSLLPAIATLWCASLTSCTNEPIADVGANASAIVGGKPADADSAIVWMVAKIGKQSGFCSATVISPHVVLTAAHCSEEEAEYSIFLGNDYNDAAAKADPANYVPVVEHHAHPKFRLSPSVKNDVGVLITATPIPRAPIPIARTPLTKGDIGASIRLIGFGQTTAGEDETMGRRHQAKAKLAAFDATSVEIDGTPNFCFFDSGGPTLMQRDGEEVLIGIHSVTSSGTCDEKAWDERVDGHAAFIDGYIAKADPPPEEPDEADAGADPSASASPSPSASGCAIGTPAPTTSGGLALVFAVGLAISLASRSSRGSRSRGSARCARDTRGPRAHHNR